MVSIYSSTEVNFNHSGIIVFPTSCVVTEELNGSFDLKMVHPYDEFLRFEKIVPYSIIRANTPKGYQLFRIYEVSHKSTKNTNYLTAYARHIFYDNLYNVHQGVCGKYTAVESMRELLKSDFSFEVSSDIEDVIDVDIHSGNVVKMIMDGGGVLDYYSGNIVRDNFKIEINSSIGEDKNVVLEYGKNISGITYEIDISEVVTRILPVGFTKSGTEVYLTELYVDSENIGNYFKELYAVREYNDLYDDVSSLSTSKIREIIKERAESEILEGCDLPTIRIDIDFVHSKNDLLNQLKEIDIGDYIRVKYPLFDVDIKIVCVKYVYDACLEMLTSIELGERKKDFSDTFMEMSSGLTNLKNNYQNLQSTVENIIGDDSSEE